MGSTMKESIHRYFQLGTLTWMSFPGKPIEETVRLLAQDEFFDSIELCHCPDEHAVETCRQLLSASHLRVCFGAHPQQLGSGLNPNDLVEEKRLAAQEQLFQAVAEAAKLGAKEFAFLAGKYTTETKEQAYEQLLKTTNAVCARAADFGIEVALELFDYDIDKSVLIGPAPLAARFAADVRCTSKNFGLLVDLSHIPLTHEDPATVVSTTHAYITHLHYGNAVLQKNCAAYGDKHPRFAFPNSVNDVPQMLDYLKALHSNGLFCAEKPLVLSMEVAPQPGEDPAVVLASTKRVLNRAWALLDV